MSTIELRDVTKDFGTLIAVRDVNLNVAAGEVVCLLGPSGCGKTTTLRMIAGLETATQGDIIVAGRRMNDLPPEKRDIAMVFQFYALYPSVTVEENIAFPLHYEGLALGNARSGCTKWLGSCTSIRCWAGCRGKYPRAKSSGSPLRAPSSATRTVSCSTSR